MNKIGTIKVEEIADLSVIIAGLVREGIVFNTEKLGNGTWEIELTGGF